MVYTYIKIATRNFIKEKFFSILNIAGLCVGITVALLIALYIIHETSYDKFHQKENRIYRLITHVETSGNVTEMTVNFPLTAKFIKAEIPEVEQAIRLYPLQGRIFKNDEKIFVEDDVLYADPEFFNVFSFQVLAGNPSTSLQKPYQILLTPKLVRKYFSTENWDNVIGKSISINQEIYEITGVVEEAPENSHFKFSAVGSLESVPEGRDETWKRMTVRVYLQLKENASIQTVEDKIPAVMKAHLENYDKLASQGVVLKLIPQALTYIHLHSNVESEFEPNGNVTTVYIFGSVACIVLLLASVNFVNLVTARSAKRAREVGVRKVLGSAFSQLVWQFTLESIILVFMATVLSLGMVALLRFPFNQVSGKALPFHILLTPEYFSVILLFVILLGILAGSYPAFFLASFSPAQVLKGKSNAGFKKSNLRNGLVVIQFVISIALITSTLIVQHQLRFMRSKKLGFDKENIVVIDNAQKLSNQQAFITSLKSIPNVQSAAAGRFKPIEISGYDGMALFTEDDSETRKLTNYSSIDHDYLSVLKYEFVEGRNFSRDIASDSSAVIINQRAAELLFGKNALGKKFARPGSLSRKYTVIGIIKDFNFESLRNEVKPIVFFLSPNERFLHVRINPGDYSKTIAQIKTLWKEQSDMPFSYAFLDESYNNLFKEEAKLETLFSIFTALALFIACLGLIGLAAYIIEQRKKEISIRKVHGARPSQIVILMAGAFVRIMLIAFVLAVPLSYFMMRRWLEGFAYRVNISFTVLISGGIAVIIIALLTVIYQAIRAGLLNPVKSLKEE
jgi:putative ABC transport system permease protein